VLFWGRTVIAHASFSTSNITSVIKKAKAFLGRPDFNFRQFRSNFVMRWEYSPGSTLFVVWSQGRTGFESQGEFSFRNDLRDLFNVFPDNVFLVKLNRWFAL
jgi:hypothetical protein